MKHGYTAQVFRKKENADYYRQKHIESIEAGTLPESLNMEAWVLHETDPTPEGIPVKYEFFDQEYENEIEAFRLVEALGGLSS